jgi:hypothetical protein
MAREMTVVVAVRMTPRMARMLDLVRGDCNRSEFLRRCLADVVRRSR